MTILAHIPLLFLINCKTSDFDFDPRSLTALPGEISAQRAFQIAAKWTETIYDGTKSIGRPFLCLSQEEDARIWNITLAGEFEFELNTKSGELLYFYDHSVPSVTSKVQPYSEWKPQGAARSEFLESLGRKFGAPENVSMKGVYDGNIAKGGLFVPYISAVFNVYSDGRLVTGAYGTYTVDVRSGRMHEIVQNYGFEIIHRNPTFSIEAAVDVAKVAYQDALKGRTGHDYEPSKPPSTFYEIADFEKPKRKTIAYFVTFGPDGVSVDATTGKVIRVSLKKGT